MFETYPYSTNPYSEIDRPPNPDIHDLLPHLENNPPHLLRAASNGYFGPNSYMQLPDSWLAESVNAAGNQAQRLRALVLVGRINTLKMYELFGIIDLSTVLPAHQSLADMDLPNEHGTANGRRMVRPYQDTPIAHCAQAVVRYLSHGKREVEIISRDNARIGNLVVGREPGFSKFNIAVSRQEHFMIEGNPDATVDDIGSTSGTALILPSRHGHGSRLLTDHPAAWGLTQRKVFEIFTKLKPMDEISRDSGPYMPRSPK